MRLTSKRHKITSALLTCILTVTLGSFTSAASESNISNQVDLAKPVQKISGWIAGQTELSVTQQDFVGSWAYKHYRKVSKFTCTAFYKAGTSTKQLRILRKRAENVCEELKIALPYRASKVSLLPSKVKSNQGQIYARFNLVNTDNQPSSEDLAALDSFVSMGANGCPVYDFENIFPEEFFGRKWGRNNEPFTISWTVNVDSIGEDSVERRFSEREMGWLRLALDSWDENLSSFEMVESDKTNADIQIGLVSQISWTPFSSPAGFFTAWSTPSGQRIRATLALNASHPQFRHKEFFIHLVQHEMGNILGFGDMLPNDALESVQEDPVQAPVGNVPLSDWDIGMMRQIYGESTCPESWR